MIVAMARNLLNLLLALLLGCASCILDSMLEEGRACAPAHPCASGYLCSAAGRCARPILDRAVADRLDVSRDLPLDLSADRPADVAHSDARRDGPKCIADTDCPAGLSCVLGQCRCESGGQRACAGGCCASDVCIPAANQSASQCGISGKTCKSCDDNNPCTTDKCTNGLCSHGVASGPTCTYCDDAGCRAGVCSYGVCFPQG